MKSFLIDDILDSTAGRRRTPPPSPQQQQQPPTARPLAVYPAAAAAPAEQPRLPFYLEDARVPPLLAGYGLPHHLYPAHFKAVLNRCWTVLPTYPMSMLAGGPGRSKRKGGQVRFSSEQTATLEKRFAGHKYLSPEERRHLAGQLKLTDRQVKTWFQNRRAKWRRANQATSSDSSKEKQRSPGNLSSSEGHDDEDSIGSSRQTPISVTS